MLVVLLAMAAAASLLVSALDLNHNYCYAEDGSELSCSADENGFAYELEWYDIQTGALQQNKQITFIAKVARKPIPEDKQASSSSSSSSPPPPPVAQIEACFVLICREGAADCSPLAHKFSSSRAFELDRIKVEGPFDFPPTLEGIDAEAYKLKSFDFISPHAEALTFAFILKLDNGRFMAIKVRRDIVNGNTLAVPRVDTALCAFPARFDLQIQQQANGGLGFSVLNTYAPDPTDEEKNLEASEKQLSRYRIGVLEYGDLRSPPTLNSPKFLGASLTREKDFTAGNLVHTLPFVDAELGFAGPNSILGRQLLLVEENGSVLSECLPSVHTVLAEEREGEEDAEEEQQQQTTTAANAETEVAAEDYVANALALLCYFRHSGSLVLLELDEEQGRILVRFTLAAPRYPVRHAKSRTVLLDASNAQTSGSFYLPHTMAWSHFPLGSTMTYNGGKCVLSRVAESSFFQRELLSLPPLVERATAAAAASAVVTTASCIFPRLGQLVFFRHSANNTARMEYSLLTSRNTTRLEFFHYGVSLASSSSNAVEFDWEMPPSKPRTVSAGAEKLQVVSGAVSWAELDLDRLVGRLVKADADNYCLVRVDAVSRYFQRQIASATTTASPIIKAAHCAFPPSSVDGATVALWFKQMDGNPQILVKTIISQPSNETMSAFTVYFQPNGGGARDNAALLLLVQQNTSASQLDVDTLLPFATDYEHLDQLYGREFVLLRNEEIVATCIVATVQVPETPGTVEAEAAAGEAPHPRTKSPLSVPEVMPPSSSTTSTSSSSSEDGRGGGGGGGGTTHNTRDNRGSRTREKRDSSTIPILLLVILASLAGTAYLAQYCLYSKNSPEQYQHLPRGGIEMPPIGAEKEEQEERESV